MSGGGSKRKRLWRQILPRKRYRALETNTHIPRLVNDMTDKEIAVLLDQRIKDKLSDPSFLNQLLSLIPKPKDGEDGQDGSSPTQEQLNRMIQEAMPSNEALCSIIAPLIPAPIKGDSPSTAELQNLIHQQLPTQEQIQAMIPSAVGPSTSELANAVATYLQQNPPIPGKDGLDGKTPTNQQIVALITPLIPPAIGPTTTQINEAVANYLIDNPPPKGDKFVPLSGVKTFTMPLLALGGLWSDTITVPGATVEMGVILLVPTELLSPLNTFSASVVSPNTVRIQLKAGLALTAGNRTFGVRVV